jgi:nucleoside-diphosphate-sugar epimerase
LADWGKIYAARQGFTFANVMLEHFYGPFDRNTKFIQFVLEALFADKPLDLTEGTQKRDFIYIDDVVDGYMCILDEFSKESKKGGEISGKYLDISLGSGECPSVREVVEFLKRETGSGSALNFGSVLTRKNEPTRLVADLTFMSSLKFKPKYDWMDGMRKTIEEMRGL